MTPPFVSRRKKVVVERSTQYRFARFVILFAVGTAFVTSATVFFTTFSLLGDRLADVYPQGRLQHIFRTVYLAFGVILIITAPIIFYASLRFSNRIFGPLPKMYEVLRNVGKGDFSQEVQLRRTDQLHEMAGVINEMVKNLRNAKDKQSP